MKTIISNALHHARQLIRTQNVIEATRMIQRALGGPQHSPSPEGQSSERSRSIEPQFISKGYERSIAEPSQAAAMTSASKRNTATEGRPDARMKRPLGEVLELLRQTELPRFVHDSAPLMKFHKAPRVPVPDGAVFLARTFTCEAGARDYKIYVPSCKTRRKRPLIVMLHGCSQNPDDFALGTAMNGLAEEHNFIVAYPAQSVSANPSVCWNWFKRTDQLRDLGEPSIIAGMTRTIMAEFGIDSGRVYIGGLSAGGAMAAIMSTTYPELFAATAIHSGLAYGSASDMVTAFAAMRGASSSAAPARGKGHRKSANGRGRIIVFHGAADQSVHPSNAEMILADARAGLTGSARETQQEGVTGGRPYRRIVIDDAHGVPHLEYWSIEGLGHAWSGGSPEGSYTDQQGPDASREMLRFFLGNQAKTSMR
jgi:poly(hydroxyalkanoate) depolymerase family esterase